MAANKAKNGDAKRSARAVVSGLFSAIAEMERQQDGEKLNARAGYERIERQHGQSELAHWPAMVALVWLVLGIGALAFAANWWWG